MPDDRLPDESGAIRDPEHLLPEHATPGTPGQIAATDDPGVARAEIEQTRARMSSTIDQLESALLRKKTQLQDRLDVMAPVRERPLPAAALAFAGGLVLGFLTGGGDRDDGEPRARRGTATGGTGEVTGAAMSAGAGVVEVEPELAAGGDEDWKRRAREWERRSRQLMRTCSTQEQEILRLREQMVLSDGGAFREPEEGPGMLRSAVRTVRDSLLGGVADGVTGAFRSLGRSGGETPVTPGYGDAATAAGPVRGDEGYDGVPLADDYDHSHLQG